MKFKGFILLGLLFAVLLVTSALTAGTSKREKKANEVKDMNGAAKSIQVDTEQMGESDQAINQAAEKNIDIGGGWSRGSGGGGGWEGGGGGGYGGEGGLGGGGYGGEGGLGGGGYGGEGGPGGGGYGGEGGPGGGGYGWRGGGRGGGGGHCRLGCCGGYGLYGCWRCC